MKLTKILLFFSLIVLTSCKKDVSASISITNNLDISRTFETVEISIKNIKEVSEFKHYSIIDEEGEIQISQEIDTDENGSVDILLFQPKLVAKETKTYFVVEAIETDTKDIICYSRFVPERTDDYAWENDKVAFRVYGPTAQKMKEDGVEGGTLSSGVDCWLKRVEYPIINKWYKKYADKTGTYHEDTGEGLDNYHVGTSSGCGGIAIKTDSSYAISKNYINYKTITTGLIRTQFSLEYATWNASGKSIKESRIITLDKGNNLSKFEIALEGTNTVSIGLTLHKNDGNITKNKEKGWISYWENLDDSELGTSVVVSPKSIVDFETYISPKDDVKNQYVQVTVSNNKVTYYAGFGWKKSKQFQTNKEWSTYLTNFSKRITSPLKVTIN